VGSLAQALSRVITRVEELCLSWGTLGIALLTVGNVLSRMLLGQSILFAQELSQFLIVLVTFMGVGYAVSEGRHIRMTALYDALPPRWRKRLMLLITASSSALLAWLAWLGFDYAWGTVRVLSPVSPVLQVPLHWVYLAAPLGLGLGAMQYALAFVKNVTTEGIHLSFQRVDEYDDAPPQGVP
jgi:TRAP-type C4-dicarboxylate transport system permease small subunit